LKKVLKKLQMNQDVEMKAYQMVEEMLTERQIEGVTTTKAMKSSPLLRPFCDSEFWAFFLLKI
jgi:hypothetical protein